MPGPGEILTYALTTGGVEAVNERGEGLSHRSTTVWQG